MMACAAGLIALCPDSNNTVLACPGLKPGYVHLRLNDINVRQSTLDLRKRRSCRRPSSCRFNVFL